MSYKLKRHFIICHKSGTKPICGLYGVQYVTKEESKTTCASCLRQITLRKINADHVYRREKRELEFAINHATYKFMEKTGLLVKEIDYKLNVLAVSEAGVTDYSTDTKITTIPR